MRKSYYPNYFSLEDIMAAEERIPVEVKKGKLLHLKSASFLRITAWLSIDKFPNR